MAAAACELCAADSGVPIVSTAIWRVVRVADDAFPAFYRVIWNAHVSELSDLPDADRAVCMDVVVAIERALREQLQPTKINLASLGNVVPHLHWHVIARFDWDSHFPQPIWAPARRVLQRPAVERLAVPLEALDAAVERALSVRVA